jgi:NAD(P)-dependent dehydrogenase (short-subunit alcohol dehydrogenase family)
MQHTDTIAVPPGDTSSGGLAVVIGGSGGIGTALVTQLQREGRHAQVLALSRRSTPTLDITDEASIAAVAAQLSDSGLPLRLLIIASGVLHGPGMQPEKSLAALDAAALTQSLAVNAIGPALVMKHLLPLLPKQGRAVCAALSARVGSIGDNQLGGWYAYRAAKAALNQLVHTAAIELRRLRPQALCVALHPGTVDTGLSAPFAKTGLEVRGPAEAAEQLLAVLEGLTLAQSGGFYDWRGEPVPW